MSVRAVKVRVTDRKRCEWIEKNRRCRDAPEWLLLQDEPSSAALVCQAHLDRLAVTDPQRWAPPAHAYVITEDGRLMFLVAKRP